jgi:hypothetical protein
MVEREVKFIRILREMESERACVYVSEREKRHFG